MSKTRIGIYPGTFDPFTNGHMDIISRAAKVVDRLVVGVARHTGKRPLFSLEERLDMAKGEIAAFENPHGTEIKVQAFDSLLMSFAESVEAQVIVRGLRAVSDFEYEFQMAGMNARLNREVETMFLMASDRHQFIASRFVKEIGRLGGDVGHFVSPRIKARMIERFAEREDDGEADDGADV